MQPPDPSTVLDPGPRGVAQVPSPVPARSAGGFRRIVEILLHVDDTPTRVAGAFALGAGLGFSPLLGAQIILGMTLAVVFRLNKVAVTAGLFINLPWIQVPYYWAATAAAGWAIGVPVPDDLRASFGTLLSISPFSGAFWTKVDALVRPWLLPFAIGTTAGALVIAAGAYTLALVLLRRRAARRPQAA